MVLILLKHGADINQRSDDGKTPLMWAATRNNCDMMQFLLENGADVHAVDNEGLNVLDVCVIRNVFKATKFIYHGGHGLEFRPCEEYLGHMVNRKFDIDLFL
jgi:ankyrin repeat protein